MTITLEKTDLDLRSPAWDPPCDPPMSSLDLASQVRDPLPYLRKYWTPPPPPPCSAYVMERVLNGLRQLGPPCTLEHR